MAKKGQVKYLRGMPVKPRTLKKDKNISPKEARKRKSFSAEYPKYRVQKGVFITKTATNRAKLESDGWDMKATLYKPRKKGDWILQLTESHPKLGDRYRTEVKTFTDGINLFRKLSDFSSENYAESFSADEGWSRWPTRIAQKEEEDAKDWRTRLNICGNCGFADYDDEVVWRIDGMCRNCQVMSGAESFEAQSGPHNWFYDNRSDFDESKRKLRNIPCDNNLKCVHCGERMVCLGPYTPNNKTASARNDFYVLWCDKCDKKVNTYRAESFSAPYPRKYGDYYNRCNDCDGDVMEDQYQRETTYTRHYCVDSDRGKSTCGMDEEWEDTEESYAESFSADNFTDKWLAHFPMSWVAFTGGVLTGVVLHSRRRNK